MGCAVSTRVAAALSVVQYVAGRPDPTRSIPVGLIARELGMTLSATSRLCSELQAAGLLDRAESYGSYRIGREAIRLSGRAGAPFARSVRFALTLAAQQTGETVFLAAGSSGGIRVIDAVESIWTLHSAAEVGELIAEESSAVSVALGGLNADGAAAHFESTVGMSVEVATPILGPDGQRIAAVAIRLPTNRSAQNLDRARRALVAARRNIERALGEPAPTPHVAAPSATTNPTAVHAALRILHYLANGSSSIAAIARATGLRADRAKRIVESCRTAGFVVETGNAVDYQLAWIVLGWHRAATAPIIVDRGTPLVVEAATRTKTCAFITVLKGMRSFTLVEHLALAGDGLQMASWLGRAHPIIGSDGGPTMLMDFTADEITRMFPTRHTRREADAVLEQVREVTHRGVLAMQAFDDAGLVSISAPVRDASGAVIAAACIVGTTDYVRDNIAEFENAAVALAAEVTALLDA